MKKISITGTKGKTSVVNLLDNALRKFDNLNVLKVDTTGHFMNGHQLSTLDDSKRIWGLVPSVCPGRYLYEFESSDNPENDVAVLESSLGSSALPGMGYRYHDIGLFLNVFWDHIGSSDRIQSQEDIANAKSFVFKKIGNNGFAVFNADDFHVCSKLPDIPSHRNVTLLPCGLTFEEFDLKNHLDSNGSAITIKDGFVTILSQSEERPLVEVSKLPWTFHGSFIPSVYNLMFVVASLVSYFNFDLPSNFTEVIESIKMPRNGRLTRLISSKGTQIIADYAHEEVSLSAVADLARTLIPKNGKVIGVVRLAHDRTDSHIFDTGKAIGSKYDELVVFDKIDGYWRKPQTVGGLKFPQVIGRTSEILQSGILESNSNSTRIIREDEAIQYAASIANPQDIVVVIVNDDIERSFSFIEQFFEAKFL